ncbi:MAG: PrgI family protein [Candidatus Niyogibacteria bacterium]|nr:PrgI family protein [Candidatus Niyogibacteria bacterium]
MRQFDVPQFIDVEDKIFGPLTLKQFVYLLGGAASVFILYVFLPFFLVILFGLPVAGFALALAFYKINNQPFIKVVGNAISYYLGSRLYIWKRGETESEKPAGAKTEGPKLEVPKVTRGKLKDLAWSLDVKEKVK